MEYKNLLPFDGEVIYYNQESIFTDDQADVYFERLTHEIAWAADRIMMFL